MVVIHMIKREHYLQQIRPFYESDLIKIITGIRRCGKSVIMDQIIAELQAEGKRILKLNFEDRAVSSSIENDTELCDRVEQELGAEKLYVFLDEVQLVENWHLAVRSLRLKNASVFITGSNYRLLSREFTKELSGRYVSFCVRPFIYQELQEYAAELGKGYSITDYLLYGGFPKVLEMPDKPARLRYLNDLDETIVLNDIINRYNIRKVQIFRRLVNYVLISNARIFSGNSVFKYLRSQKLECSINTVMKYLGYLEGAYVIRQIPQYSSKAKRELNFFAKLYNEDVAFNTIRQPQGSYDLTHNLENVVYNELVYRGYELSVYNVNGQEIDFLASKDGREYLIQVAYSVAEAATYKREFGAFDNLDNSRQKLVITNDEVDFSTSTVRHLKLRDFFQTDEL